MPMPIRFLLSLLACALVAQSPALAASPEQWEAVSTTAMAITGNVRFSPDRITFQNGKFLAFAPAGAITVTEGRENRPATLYRVTKPDDPILLQGTRLCGGRTPEPVTFSRRASTLGNEDVDNSTGGSSTQRRSMLTLA
jgi:hypothetical protein